MKKVIEGTCHICGKKGPLSFEHVPPEAAFNNRRIIRLGFEQAMVLGPDEMGKGPIQQRGAGGYTLCPKCNNDTGGWYSRRFVDWCYKAMEILQKSDGNPTLIYVYDIYPLAIIKQIVTMFFSVNGPDFRLKNEELVKFVLDKEAKYLSPRYGFYIYYNLSQKLRYTGITGKLDVNTLKVTLLSEICFPPFGYLMTVDSEQPDQRLAEITHFARYDYSQSAWFQFRLPVLPTHTIYPGDYRTEEQITADVTADLEFQRQHSRE